ncbi:MAG: hypothetical protein J0H14_00330 [Alphaproteobacteria bacterium]|nr:hypothetical protein [Alphaproteobacteria bacterium]
MSETEDRLYGLMEIADRQQAAVEAALEGLAAERAALQHEREQLARQVEALDPSTRAAVRSAVRASFAGAATEGVAAVEAATQPLLGRLDGMTEAAGRAEHALRRVILWASWRLLGWLLAMVAGLMLLNWVANTGRLWWDSSAIGAAEARKAQLQAEVAEMQAAHDEWAKAGMLGKLARCNPGNRPCIRVDEGAGGFGSAGDYRVILGY